MFALIYVAERHCGIVLNLARERASAVVRK